MFFRIFYIFTLVGDIVAMLVTGQNVRKFEKRHMYCRHKGFFTALEAFSRHQLWLRSLPTCNKLNRNGLLSLVGNGPSRPLGHRKCPGLVLKMSQDIFGKKVHGPKVIWGHISHPFILRGHNLKLKLLLENNIKNK